MLVSYYLTPATVAEQDKWEASLNEATRDFWASSFTGDVPVVHGDRFVLMRGTNDMVFLLTGSGLHDELGLVEPMDYCIACVRETCDRSLNPEKVLSFHGKVRVCLNEMFFGGDLVCTDVEHVLRSAKLKPPKL